MKLITPLRCELDEKVAIAAAVLREAITIIAERSRAPLGTLETVLAELTSDARPEWDDWREKLKIYVRTLYTFGPLPMVAESKLGQCRALMESAKAIWEDIIAMEITEMTELRMAQRPPLLPPFFNDEGEPGPGI